MNQILPKRVLLAVTCPVSWTFYKGIPSHLHAAGFDPILLSSPGDGLRSISEREEVASVAVPMERGIAPSRDVISLFKLYRAMRRVRPDIVDASTPKAGLLVSIAAYIACVPQIVYTLRGLRLETETGMKWFILWMTEWIACACADHVVCVSPSLRECAIALKLVPREKTVVLGSGSSGVDMDRFTPKDHSSVEVRNLRRKLGIPDSEPVVGFVGRFVKDKGIQELFAAFQKLQRSFPGLRLLLVGDFEENGSLDPELRRAIESTPEILRVGFVADPAPYYRLMDVLAFPTHREGFGQVSIEAQASGVPVVTTQATGAVDSVVNGITGYTVPVGDSNALADAIGKLLKDPELRANMRRAGREWTERNFRLEGIWDAQVELYRFLPGRKDTTGMPDKMMFKRAFDICVSMLALLLLSPVFLIVAILVRLSFGSPILFKQARPGLNGESFTLFKFRTMNNARGSDGELLPDAQRLTAFGRFLRSTSLDELPELFNVIRGEMSLVGPRPLLAQYLDRYTPEQMRRHLVKPGITGWAQVNGRNSLDWEEKFALDLWYVEHQSFALDLRILVKTVFQVLLRNGIAQEGHATMPEFLGALADREKGNA
jgi:lipopolysaccharide/colanic/teichoic acid biosynthesis glycosyltransferase/glycosyltransferase involved in cell wall biosynthesis